jgi:hypothetical protein
MEWAWAGAGDSPRGRAEPGPGVASPPMPPRPSAPVLRGSRRGPPRARGWAMGGGRWGGGAGPSGRETGSSYRGPVPPCPARRGGPPPSFGVGVPPWCRTHPARRRPAAVGAGRVVPSVCSRQDRHRVAGGRVAFSPLAVRCRAGWKAVVACPGVGAAVAGMGGDRRGRSVARACRRSAGRARSPAIPPRHAGRASPRALCAPVAKCVWARCRGRSFPLTPRCAGPPGVPSRRRGGRRRGHDPRPY